MSPALWRKVEDLFRAAVALDPRDRQTFLDRANRDAPEAFAEVRRLLEHDRAAARDWPELSDSSENHDRSDGDGEPSASLPRMSVSLRVIDGPHQGDSFTFCNHDMFITGRSPNAHFRLPFKDKTLSRYQFLVEINPPYCRVMDMASTNGTRVNGQRVTSSDLKDGDSIKAGETTFAVTIENTAPPTPVDSLDSSLLDMIQRNPGRGERLPVVPGYQLERRIGEGGMGVVFVARNDQGASVAIKMITPAVLGSGRAIARFLREASILRQLEHSSIVRFHTIGQTEGRLFFVMDYVCGTDVHTLIKKRGPLSMGQAVRVIAPLLEALGYAHRRGFVHRDVKPSNLLLAQAENRTAVKLADFGLARLYQNSPLSGLTLTGQVAGTVGFMPPEQITDFREAKPPVDQYAAGATLYYLLTGSTVYDFPVTAQGQLVMILTKDPVPIRSRQADLAEGLAAIVHRSLARDPLERFPSVEAMCDALKPFLSAP